MYMRNKKDTHTLQCRNTVKNENSSHQGFGKPKKSIVTAKIKKYFSIKQSSCPPGKSGGPIHVFTRNVDFYFHIYMHKCTYIHIK